MDGTLERNKIDDDDGDDEIEVVCKNKWISQLIPFKKYVFWLPVHVFRLAVRS